MMGRLSCYFSAGPTSPLIHAIFLPSLVAIDHQKKTRMLVLVYYE